MFVWASLTDGNQADFLAVVDADASSPSYGRVLKSLSVGVPTSMAHHTDYQMPENGILFANDYDSGLTFRFDLRNPQFPALLGHFGDAGPYTHPHSFARLANGNVLSTYQTKGQGNKEAGALVELDPQGKPLRSFPAAALQVDSFIRPYSLAVIPSLDRVVTTSYDMFETGMSHVVQVWSLSELRLLKTIRLTPGKRGVENVNSAEPRVLGDGRTVLVSTFSCGLYQMVGLEGANPTAKLAYDFDATSCGVPATAGHYWFQNIEDKHAIVSLDISDLSHPKEIARLRLGQNDAPHWLSMEPNGKRVVVTGYEDLANQIVILNVGDNGLLSLDKRFHSGSANEPGIRFDRKHWPTVVPVPRFPTAQSSAFLDFRALRTRE